MRVVVVGGTGYVGRRVVEAVQHLGHAVVSASPSNGVNTVTGRGIDRALERADVVIDVTNPTSTDAVAAREFFQASTRRLLKAEREVGVKHHVVLSLVGADSSANDGYFSAKAAQESMVEAGSIPFSILRATQFFEFARTIAAWNTHEDTVRLPGTEVEPIAVHDVVAALVEVASSAARNTVVDIAGPERMSLDGFVRQVLLKDHDTRYVVQDASALPHGFNVGGRLLVPAGSDRMIAPTTLGQWLDTSNGRR
ncbi:NmrA family NAD(P)-binding protein [Herbiconiux sp. CPCC 205716]|uniref:NmrA family NAD(P)-binding protein n=1 Tax=Herbiconiux gentiana TaxID=2970912 RepID=A0ABT2GE79_9MICO|nr:NmrA family NAD(P)-binding protein [Herbiconiux gentiana]MCS5713194.1 NmrA family NAD(P)-binding protein [Herbiconiux gentiana]